jgi:hypothetical protein
VTSKAFDHAAMAVEFERRSDFRILKLVELGVVDDEERVVGIDVLDLALLDFGSSEKARIVETDDRDALVQLGRPGCQSLCRFVPYPAVRLIGLRP